jgi:hypothetical protein
VNVQSSLPLPSLPKAESGKGGQSSFVSELGPTRGSVSLARSVTLSQAFMNSSGKGSKGSGRVSGLVEARVSRFHVVHYSVCTVSPTAAELTKGQLGAAASSPYSDCQVVLCYGCGSSICCLGRFVLQFVLIAAAGT